MQEDILKENSTEKMGEAEVFKVESFDGEHFIVTKYGLYLGFSTLELKSKMLTSFIEKDIFKEITKDKFDTIACLCIDPYVTDWNSNNEPKYYRIMRGSKLNNDQIKFWFHLSWLSLMRVS